ncbi:hypothetical protein SNE40_020998 [Patella caerulea]|uniref:SOCS box domain-containing protein n=1 Tax=Patella caerulea TaxID=87958 RepID=A0AAN8GH71_PATCE
MGCVFSQTVLSFTPLLSDDQERVQVKERRSKFGRFRKTSVKFEKMESKTAKFLPCGCNTKPNKKTKTTELTLEDAIRLRDKALIIKMMFNNEEETGWGTLDVRNKKHAKISPVELACHLGYSEIVELFLENGCSPNLPTKTGRLIHSVLDSMKSKHFSLSEGHGLISKLLSLGCDVNMKDNQGHTTLLYCAELGHIDTMEMILHYAATSQLSTQCGGNLYTPLHMSVMRGDYEIVKILLQHSAKKHINMQDSHGNTALILTLQAMLHCAQYLMANNEPNPAISSEQQLIFKYNSIAILEALLNAGADPNIASEHVQMSSDYGSRQHYRIPLFIALQLAMCELAYAKISPVSLSKLYSLSRHRLQVYNDIFSDLTYFLNANSSDESSNLISRRSSSGQRLASPSEEEDEDDDSALPYAGMVRLLMLSGTNLSSFTPEDISRVFPSVEPLIREIFEFWRKFSHEKPPRLLHLTKQVIRGHLATVRKLHEIDELPLPARVKEYVKLKSL